MVYQLFALITGETDLPLGRVADLMRQEFASVPGAIVALAETPPGEHPRLEIRWTDWAFRLAYSDMPHVLEESREIDDACADGRPDRDRIAGCRRRLELASDEDPEMDHFNDYLFIQERLGQQDGVVLFDLQAGEFIEG